MVLAEYGIEYRYHHKPAASIRSTRKHLVTLPTEECIDKTTGCDKNGVHSVTMVITVAAVTSLAMAETSASIC